MCSILDGFFSFSSIDLFLDYEEVTGSTFFTNAVSIVSSQLQHHEGL